MTSSTLMLKMEVDSDEKFETKFQSCIKQQLKGFYKTPSSDIILTLLWQSEGLAWPSVVLPLHPQVFGSCCISTKPAIFP